MFTDTTIVVYCCIYLSAMLVFSNTTVMTTEIPTTFETEFKLALLIGAFKITPIAPWLYTALPLL